MRAATLPHAGVIVNRRVSLQIVSSASHVIALSTPPVPGSVLVCFYQQLRIPGDLTPPAGFTLAGAMIQRGAAAFSMGCWYRVTVPGDTGSLTFAAAVAAFGSAQLLELVGLSGAAPDYNSADAGATSVLTASSGTIASSAARGIAIAAIATDGNAGTFGNAWDGGFRRLYVAHGNNDRLTLAYRMEVPAGTALATHEDWTTVRKGLGIVACFPQAA